MLAQDSLESDEKRIAVDPFFLKESVNLQPGMISPVSTPTWKTGIFHIPPLHPPTKSRFLSYSVPSSASSSPKFGSMISTKKSRNPNQVIPLSAKSFSRQDSIALANLERLREAHLRKSKSCGEGRTSAPPEALDLLMVKSSVKVESFKAEVVKMERSKSYGDGRADDSTDEKVKCGALCLFLPSFGKAAKPIKARKEEPQEMVHFQEAQSLELVVSKRVSLEKFECGSWRSSVILDDGENPKDSSNLFFDLPLEMIRCGANDTHLPVTTAFVFDKDRKGVLKKSSSTSRKSRDSSRHVRFSTSSPTPCAAAADHDALQKAREDLNAFLAVKYL